MRSNCRVAAVAALLSMFSFTASATTEQKFNGQYTVTLTDRSGTQSQFCFTFANTGQVSGYPNSGTWMTPAEDVDGYFIVQHQKLEFYGTYYTIENFVSGTANLKTGAGNWVNFAIGAVPGGAGTVTLVPGC